MTLMNPPQDIINPEVTDAAATRLIEFSVIGAAFVLVFFFSIALVFWVLRASAKEMKAQRQEAQSVNARSFQAAEKATENYTKIAERMERILSMLNRQMDALQILVLRGGHDDPLAPTQDG